MYVCIDNIYIKSKQEAKLTQNYLIIQKQLYSREAESTTGGVC